MNLTLEQRKPLQSYTYDTNYKADVLIRINYKEMNGRFLNCLCDEFQSYKVSGEYFYLDFAKFLLEKYEIKKLINDLHV